MGSGKHAIRQHYIYLKGNCDQVGILINRIDVQCITYYDYYLSHNNNSQQSSWNTDNKKLWSSWNNSQQSNVQDRHIYYLCIDYLSSSYISDHQIETLRNYHTANPIYEYCHICNLLYILRLCWGPVHPTDQCQNIYLLLLPLTRTLRQLQYVSIIWGVFNIHTNSAQIYRCFTIWMFLSRFLFIVDSV